MGGMVPSPGLEFAPYGMLSELRREATIFWIGVRFKRREFKHTQAVLAEACVQRERGLRDGQPR